MNWDLVSTQGLYIFLVADLQNHVCRGHQQRSGEALLDGVPGRGPQGLEGQAVREREGYRPGTRH